MHTCISCIVTKIWLKAISRELVFSSSWTPNRTELKSMACLMYLLVLVVLQGNANNVLIREVVVKGRWEFWLNGLVVAQGEVLPPQLLGSVEAGDHFVAKPLEDLVRSETPRGESSVSYTFLWVLGIRWVQLLLRHSLRRIPNKT